MSQPPHRDPRQPFTRPGTRRDPRQPFGQQPPDVDGHPGGGLADPTPLPPELAAPPQDRRPLLFTVVALAAVALLLVGAFRLGGQPSGDDPVPGAAPSTTTRTSAPASPAPAPATGILRSIPFTNAEEGSAGTYEILQDEWTDEGLVLTIRVSLTRGRQRLDFFALDNGPTARQYDPRSTGPDYLAGQPIEAGQTRTGRVLFQKQRGDTTVFLAGTHGRQVAALKVQG